MVSVVMAAKNYARFLPFAIESVQSQTFRDWELLIIDDGSSDDTPLVVQRFLGDPRIRYVRSDVLGQSRAKNLGIRLSCGETIAFLDADDAWRPTKLEKQLKLLADDVGVVSCLRELIDEHSRPIPFRTPPPLPPTGRVLDAMFVQNFVCFSSAMVRRRVFEHLGVFDPRYDLAIDYALWLRVARYYSFACVPEPLVLYRTGHGNLSQKLSDRVATVFSIMRDHRDEIADSARAEGYASTARTMGWVLRRTEPIRAMRWYATAMLWPHRRVESLRGMIASALNIVRKPVATTPENLEINR